MKASEIQFEYPVMGISPDRDMWGFPDLRSLTTCGPRTVRDKSQVGMELVSLDGRRWRVASATKLGRASKLGRRILEALFLANPQYRVELELEAMAPLSLDEVKARACAGLDAFPGYFGVSDPEEPEPERSQIKAALNAAPSMEALHEILGLDTFEAY